MTCWQLRRTVEAGMAGIRKVGDQWTPSQHAEMMRMIRDGCTAADVADALGRSEMAVFHEASALGVRFRRNGRVDPEMRARVVALLTRGLSTPAPIARVVGRSCQAISKLLQRMAREGLVKKVGYGRWSRWSVRRRVWNYIDDDDLPDRVIDLALGTSPLGAGEVAEELGWDKEGPQTHAEQVRGRVQMSTTFPLREGSEVRLVTDHELSNGRLGRVVEIHEWGAVLETNWRRPNDRDGKAGKLYRAAWHEMEPIPVTEYQDPHTNGHYRNGKPKMSPSVPRSGGSAVTGNPCPNCQGANMVRTGSCVTCQDCGYNEGCG